MLDAYQTEGGGSSMTGNQHAAGPAPNGDRTERLCAGRVVVVTGAGRGIGRAHALELARQGAHVVVNDLGTGLDGHGRDPGPASAVADEITAQGGRAVANGNDVADWQGARELVEQAVETFGHLDVVVNNAGILRDQMLVNMSQDEWEGVVGLYLRSTFATTHFAAAHWRDQHKAGRPVDGRIVNTSSPAGLFGNPGQANYTTATAGIAAFTLVAAKELARYGVTVNAVSPRVARTRMTERLGAQAPSGPPPDDFDPLAPDNIAPVVAWLASTQARHVTGQVFEVAGSTITHLEGWRRGARAEGQGRWDPTKLAPVIDGLLATE
jgi:NAD(P)-dependent dehydrogenase (short-subunit alcohol dehydrogenase family)